MITELTAGPPTRKDLLTRALTPLVTRSARRMLRWNPKGSVLVELPNGHKALFGTPGIGADAHLHINSYRVIGKALRRGTLGFAEAYIDGDIDSADLTALFRFFVHNMEGFEEAGRGLFKRRIPDKLAHRLRRNTKRGSQRNISEHYDLGNDFYRLWLDADMNYSSGIYPERGNASLAAAQEAKLDRVLDLLELSGGEEILEIGCGWGAFARRAASGHGAHVTGLTLSREQLQHAEATAQAAGLGEACAFRLEDYRDTGGTYDRIASIEMIEAVGEENWPRYFRTLHDRLKPGGSAVVQAITIDEARYERYRRKPDFIQRYIFPGGMLPTATIIAGQAARAGLTLDRIERFGASYAKTLREWRDRFEKAWPEIARLGFDEAFRRKWHYYLCYCEAGFLEGTIDVGLYRMKKA